MLTNHHYQTVTVIIDTIATPLALFVHGGRVANGAQPDEQQKEYKREKNC